MAIDLNSKLFLLTQLFFLSDSTFFYYYNIFFLLRYVAVELISNLFLPLEIFFVLRQYFFLLPHNLFLLPKVFHCPPPVPFSTSLQPFSTPEAISLSSVSTFFCFRTTFLYPRSYSLYSASTFFYSASTFLYFRRPICTSEVLLNSHRGTFQIRCLILRRYGFSATARKTLFKVVVNDLCAGNVRTAGAFDRVVNNQRSLISFAACHNTGIFYGTQQRT